MARIRTIKPDFWTDEKIVELSPLARLLFIGLWNFADDEGRMPYSPTRIKFQILPADSPDILALLGEIRGKLLIDVYVVDGQEYLQVAHFIKHQKIDKRTPSKYPQPSGIPPESPRIPPTEVEVEVEGKGSKPKPRRASRSVRDGLNGYFTNFWAAYPKREARGRAEKAWIKLNPDEQLTASIVAAVERLKPCDKWAEENGKFIPLPATFLNDRRWEDELSSESWRTEGNWA